MVKPTCEELEQRIKTLEEELTKYKQAQGELKRAREEELQLLEMTTALSRELNLGDLLFKIMQTASTLLSADKCTLFMYDDNTHELWARATLDLKMKDIRILIGYPIIKMVQCPQAVPAILRGSGYIGPSV